MGRETSKIVVLLELRGLEDRLRYKTKTLSLGYGDDDLRAEIQDIKSRIILLKAKLAVLS